MAQVWRTRGKDTYLILKPVLHGLLNVLLVKATQAFWLQRVSASVRVQVQLVY